MLRLYSKKSPGISKGAKKGRGYTISGKNPVYFCF
jgi:hypothetical protein